MTLCKVLKHTIDGKKITRLDWDNKEEYCYIREGFLCIHHDTDEAMHQWVISETDLMATDWVVVG